MLQFCQVLSGYVFNGSGFYVPSLNPSLLGIMQAEAFEGLA